MSILRVRIRWRLTSHRQKCLLWTVELIRHDGSRNLTDCLETLGLSERYATLLREKQPRPQPRPKKKSKRNHEPNPEVDRTTNPAATSEPVPRSGAEIETVEDSTSLTKPGAETMSLQPATSTTNKPASVHAGMKRKSIDQSAAAAAAAAEDSTTGPSNEPSTAPPKDPETPPDHYFYLLRPHTTSSSRVLIPVSHFAPLKEILKNQIVLEFPTIYALKYAPDALPEGFILESEYLGQSKAEAQELDELLSRVKAPDLEEGEVEDGEKALQEAMDKKRLLDVLRKDLSAGR